MSKKRRKLALKFILGNSIILKKITDALGCEKNMTEKERKVIVKDMIETYADETCVDSFTVNMFGAGQKKAGKIGGGYRNDRVDDDWGFDKPRGKTYNNSILDEISFK